MSAREAWVVVDLGFGDAGKGATVEHLVRARGADLVVRFNGGAQAGHTVVAPDGRRHVFSQLGAGGFVAGVGTHLGPRFCLHPGGLAVEAERFARVAGRGLDAVYAGLTVDARALVISPYQQAANRLRELLRGAAAHGTCGVGVGEAVGDALASPGTAIRAGDLRDPARLTLRLRAQRSAKRRALARAAAALEDPRAEAERDLLDDPGALERIVELWSRIATRLRVLTPAQAAARLAAARGVVFEGAQGLLLDEAWGFHPHTTWSDTTPAGARALLADPPTRVLGLTRAYQVRHGAGPLPTHDPAFDEALPETDNADDGWQGPVRRGPLDLVLLRYAVEVAGPLDGLGLTCLDRVGERVRVCVAYELEGEHPDLVARDPDGRVVRLLPGAPDDLARRERLGELLRAARPVLRDLPRAELSPFLAAELGLGVVYEGWGPRAAERRLLTEP